MTNIYEGFDLDNLTRKDLSKLIALVPQSPFLIAGTIFENITYGIDREVSIDEVEEAAKRAYIYDYINEGALIGSANKVFYLAITKDNKFYSYDEYKEIKNQS